MICIPQTHPFDTPTPYLDLEFDRQTVGFRERCGQSLVKVGQIRSNLIDGLETAGFGETRLSGKVFSGLLGISIVVSKSQRRNNFAK